jgi:hypothetical protein
VIEQLGLALPRQPAERIAHALGWHLEDLSDFRFTLVVSGRPTPKKNHLKPIRIGGVGRIATDGEYNRWERHAWSELTAQWAQVFKEPIPIIVEINLAVVVYLENHRAWPDLSALYEGPQDVLEAHKPRCDLTLGARNGLPKCKRHAGVISNDRQICGHDGSDRRIDPDNPRCELVLTPHRRSP